MNLFDELRSRLNERQVEFGPNEGSIRAGAAFALAFSDELDEEVSRIKKGNPREDEQLISDSLQRAEREFLSYMALFDRQVGIISENSVKNAMRQYDAQRQTFFARWGLPLILGVASNFLWLFACGLVLALAFIIRADWPSVIQRWIVG